VTAAFPIAPPSARIVGERPEPNPPRRANGAMSQPVSRPAAESLGKATRAFAHAGSARCRRPAGRRLFTLRAGGRPQEFCSTACRRAFEREARSAGQRRLLAPRRSGAGRSPRYWSSGVDVATGQRVAIRIKTPSELAVPSFIPSDSEPPAHVPPSVAEPAGGLGGRDAPARERTPATLGRSHGPSTVSTHARRHVRTTR
jgi:hypothetical protein